MIEENQIDDLFEASLNGMHVNPSSGAWNRLNQELDASASSSVSFDKEVNSLMQDFKVEPSTKVWSALNQHLEAAAIAAIEFDKATAESMENLSLQPSGNAWSYIEAELDNIEAANIVAERRFYLWFGLTTTVAASLLFFFMHFSSLNIFQPKTGNKTQFVRINNDNSENASIVLGSANKNSDESLAGNNLGNSKKNSLDISDSKKNSEKNSNSNKSTAGIINSSHNNSSQVIIAKASDNSCKNSETENQTITNTANNKGDNANYYATPEEYAVVNMPAKELTVLPGLSQKDFSSQANIHIKSLRAATGFSLDLFAGPEFIINTIDQNSSVGDQAIIEEVKPVCTDFTFGANIKFNYNKFFVKSGLTYSSYGEQRIFQNNTELHDTSGGFYTYNINSYITYDTIGWVDDPLQPGGISPQLSATLHSDTLGQHWNSQDSIYYNIDKYSTVNKYRYIEIPILLGYNVNYKNWIFSLGAGVSYGFKVAEQGKYIDNNGTLKTAFNTSSPYSGFTTNGIVSLGISYNITNRISVILQPTYKTNLQELNNLSASYHNISMRMGVNIML